MTEINAVLLDLDGLLLDTEGAYDTAIYRYAVETTGEELAEQEFRTLRSKMFGRKPEESANLLVQALGLPEDKATHFLEWRKPILEELFVKAQLLPGAARLLAYLAEHDIPTAIATSSTKDTYTLKIQRHSEYFSFIGSRVITAEDVERGKPHPEAYTKAAALINAQPSQCLVFEDAPSGVASGKAAGMHVVAVPHPLLDASLVADADTVLPSLEEFSPTEWGLPPLS
ncbi:MAG: HAD-IA family hydrolase [Candidatus Andersenbacteria bacterium]